MRFLYGPFGGSRVVLANIGLLSNIMGLGLRHS